jgi:UDP-N-acetylmuramate--alanine ligase
MSAIARYFKHAGYQVSGYDRTPTRLTEALEAEGIQIHFEERPDLVPTEVEQTLVIYTPAIPKEMKELVMVQEKGYKVIKRSRALGEIASHQKCLAIAGTHGKTTTSTMLAHILTHSGEGCNAFLGGISKNYHTNLLLSGNPVLVAEADEFDRSFLQLYPEIAAITSCDADHLDIYSDHEHVKEAFHDFGAQVKGALVVKKGIDVQFDTEAEIYTYSYSEVADFYPSEVTIDNCGYFHFTLHSPIGEIKDCTVGIPGWVNVENGIAAAAVALLHGVPAEQVKSGLATFSGVERRFDIHVNTPECAYIDDYAHHPKEISAAISSIRNIFPGRRLCGIFQPHLYTRTRDFYTEFAQSLSALDELILLPIYPARELPIEGVSSEMIFDLVTIRDKKIVSKESLLEELGSRNTDILVTLGAGDINTFIGPITEMITKKIR